MEPSFSIWTDEGKARACIVTARGPSDLAAQELNRWLRRITGVALPITSSAPTRGPRVFLGGDAAWTRLGTRRSSLDLGRDGYVLRTVDTDLVVAGRTDLGTLFGVYAFLEHYLDCRWFWPGENGIHHPSRPTLRVGQIDEVSRPDFHIRWVIRNADCARFNRLNVSIKHADEFRIKWFVHTWRSLVPPKTYWPAKAEYYAEVGGKRRDPSAPRSQVNLCTTNPGVTSVAAKTIDQIMRDAPTVDMVSVDPMDTQVFCGCANCQELCDASAPYESRASRLVFDFSNRLAEIVAPRHPDLLLKTIAYHTYLTPPKEPSFALHDNVAIQFCRFMCHNHRLDDATCAENQHFHEPLKAWCKIARNVMMYEYYYKASWCGMPWPIVHALRHDLPYLRRLGVGGLATQWDHNGAANGLGFYVASKLLWDTEIDVDALLTDFYEKAYAEAAGPMRQYHERLEQAATDSGLHFATQRPYRDLVSLFTSDLLAELDQCLSAAEQTVEAPRASARVRLMRCNWQYCKLVHEYLATITRELEASTRARWYGSVPKARVREAVQRVQPLADRVKAFILDRTNAGAVHGFGSYEQLLVSPQSVANHWQYSGDRDRRDLVIDKVHWLREHSQDRLPRPPAFSLWIYGNDLDWVRETGPEHIVHLRSGNAARTEVGKIGRPDRRGDGINLCFVLHDISPDLLPSDQIEVSIDNPGGGPFASRIFAVYLTPDDDTNDDDAQRLIETDIDRVRRRAIGFAEFGYNGRWSSEGVPFAQVVGLHCLKAARE